MKAGEWVSQTLAMLTAQRWDSVTQVIIGNLSCFVHYFGYRASFFMRVKWSEEKTAFWKVCSVSFSNMNSAMFTIIKPRTKNLKTG